MKVASVGLGRWASVIAKAVARSDKLEIVTCYSRSQEKRDAFSAQFGCQQATSYEALLADDRVEAVLLTTPNIAHAETVLAAATAGKHVWIEKPISHLMRDAMSICEGLEKSGVTFSVGHSARMLGASRKMKELIDNGGIGKSSLIEAHWSNERALEITPDSWRWYADRTPGGPLIQLLVHHFDTVQYLFGPVAEVQAYKRRLNTPAEVDDVAAVIAQFESGHLGYFGSSWVSPGIYWMHVYGTEANLYHELEFNHWNQPDVDQYTTLFRQPHGTLEKVPVEIPAKDMFRDELEDFVAAVRTGRAPEVGWKEATRALACVEAAIRSSNGKRPVTIAEVMR
jgi:predicted dehydrogenase